jgi:hypothetical protein
VNATLANKYYYNYNYHYTYSHHEEYKPNHLNC